MLAQPELTGVRVWVSVDGYGLNLFDHKLIVHCRAGFRVSQVALVVTLVDAIKLVLKSSGLSFNMHADN